MIFVVVLLTLLGNASAARPLAQEIQSIVDGYYLEKFLEGTKEDHGDCPTNPKECADTLCTRLSWPNTCGDEKTLLSILKACRGNYNGGCVTALCTTLAWPNTCGDLATAIKAADACRGNLNQECFTYACKKLSWPSTCGNLTTALSVAASCGGG